MSSPALNNQVVRVIGQKFYDFCKSHAGGRTIEAYVQYSKEHTAGEVASAVSKLLSRGHFEMLTDAEGHCVFRSALPISGEEDQNSAVEAMDGDERLVYHHLCLAGNKGMWTKDLRIKTQLHLTIVNKALRSLESRRIIKSVHTVKNSTRKIYMLVGLEPAVELTGGPWFTDNVLDTELIDSIAEVCLRYVQNKTTPRSKDNILPSSFKGYPDVTDIYQFVISSNFLKGQDSNISEEHIEQIMTRLIYDGLIKRFTPRYPCPRTGFKSRIVNDFDDEDDQDTYYVYKAVKNPFSVSGIASIPCGTCPVFSRCSDTGPITPAKCLYFSKWLSF